MTLPAFAGDPATVLDLLGGIDEEAQALPIINGEMASTDLFPSTGGLLFSGTITYQGQQGSIKSFMCSSTLIAPDVVLLAAHCVDDDVLTYGYGEVVSKQQGWTRQADLTEWDGSNRFPDWPEDTVMVAETVFPPNWSLWNLSMGLSENYDIALMFLEEPVFDVPHAYLPTTEEAKQLGEGTVLDVVGWGQQVATSGNQAPPSGTYAIKMWGQSHIAQIAPYEFQVGSQSSDVRKCHGDSGGPSFAQVTADTTTTQRLVGVTSHAYDASDCNRTGGVDTRVDHYLQWIDSEMRAACADASRVWCDEPGIVYAPTLDERWDTGDTGLSTQRRKNKGEKAGLCACSQATAPAATMFLALFGMLGALRRRD